MMTGIFKKLEPIVFLLVVGWMVHPVFQYAAFYTNDGPPHLYNSYMLKDMLLGNGAVYEPFLEFNTRPEPNWLGHAMLVLFMLVAKPLVAEKLLVATYVVLMMFGFRYLVSAFRTSGLWTSLLVVPLVFTFPLHIGFYNFCLGLVLLLFTLGYWLRVANGLSVGKVALLGLLLLLGFFSHITTFMLTLACIGLFEALSVGMVSSGFRQVTREFWMQLARKWGALLMALVPSLILTGLFLRTHGGGGIPENTADALQQWNDLMKFRPITVFNHHEEEPTTSWLFLAAVATFYMVLVAGVFKWKTADSGWEVARRPNFGLTDRRHGFFLLAALFLVGYFMLPDWMSSGGFVHVRLLLLFFLMLFLWMATAKVPTWVTLPLVITALITTSQLFSIRDTYRKEQNAVVRELMEVQAHIPDGSVVLPVLENHHWFFGHASNYLGTFRPLIILDNYEADAGYFPLVWKPDPRPASYLGHPVATACGERVKEMEATGLRVDVIVHYADGTIEYGAECGLTIETWEQEEFDMVYVSQSGLTKVFLRK